MIDKTVNYLQDIELLKKIEPIAERMGLAYDDVLIYAAHPVLPCWVLGQQATKTDHYFASEDIYTYTSSSLELLLPEWCFGLNMFSQVERATETHQLAAKVHRLLRDINHSRGKQKVEALARLIILLDEEGLL